MATPIRWDDEVDDVVVGDITAALAYVTPAGGAVVTAVAPCGIADRDRGRVGFTTSLGFAKKLERIVRDPHVALAYHARDHGFSTSPSYVLAQGDAEVDLTPAPERLEAFEPQAVRYLGTVKHGRLWDRLLYEYYNVRVFVDVDVRRVIAWPDLLAVGAPAVAGAERPPPPPPQKPPTNGRQPRVDVAKVARQTAALPHRLIAYRGTDGYPVVVPVSFAGHDAAGLHLVCAKGVLPVGGRRAGLLAHSYRPELVRLATRVLTGWLDVDADGNAVYAPHTTKGFVAPPQHGLLLVINGTMAKYGVRRAAREGVTERLRALQDASDAKSAESQAR
jgi:hypothetical protein